MRCLSKIYRQGAPAALAIFFHALLFFSLIPETKIGSTVSQLKEKAIEIISPEDLKKIRKPIVQTSRLKESAPSDKAAQFAGEFQQRAEKETQSPIKGNFLEGEVFQAEENLELEREGEGEGEGKKNQNKNKNSMSLKNFMAFGQSPNALSKDIPFGNQTVLNTDKVRYASFINRIADEIYQPWVEEAEKALRYFSFGQKKMEPNLYITRLRVTLNTEGEIAGIQVVESCGVSELDEAPKKAFWETEPFPNPPKQLVDSDGYVRLNYEFQFEWKNSGFNIIPWKI